MSDSFDQNELYSELTHALAVIVYGRCVAGQDAQAEYAHFNDNRLGIPPDILARLGIMRGTNPNEHMVSGYHVFLRAWTPEKPLTLARHAGEPSMFDLIVAVCLMVDWDGGHVRVPEMSDAVVQALPTLDLKVRGRFQSETQRAYSYWAWRKAVVCGEKLGLGEWNDEGGFDLIPTLTGSQPIDLADTYQATRHLTAKRLGGVAFLFPS